MSAKEIADVATCMIASPRGSYLRQQAQPLEEQETIEPIIFAQAV